MFFVYIYVTCFFSLNFQIQFQQFSERCLATIHFLFGKGICPRLSTRKSRFKRVWTRNYAFLQYDEKLFFLTLRQGTRKTGEPNKKLPRREERRIVCTANNFMKTEANSDELAVEYVLLSTVYQVLKHDTNIVRQKLTPAPRILDRRKTGRLNFAHAQKNREKQGKKLLLFSLRCHCHI